MLNLVCLRINLTWPWEAALTKNPSWALVVNIAIAAISNASSLHNNTRGIRCRTSFSTDYRPDQHHHEQSDAVKFLVVMTMTWNEPDLINMMSKFAYEPCCIQTCSHAHTSCCLAVVMQATNDAVESASQKLCCRVHDQIPCTTWSTRLCHQTARACCASEGRILVTCALRLCWNGTALQCFLNGFDMSYYHLPKLNPGCLMSTIDKLYALFKTICRLQRVTDLFPKLISVTQCFQCCHHRCW